jgi:hypothetical protein
MHLHRIEEPNDTKPEAMKNRESDPLGGPCLDFQTWETAKPIDANPRAASRPVGRLAYVCGLVPAPSAHRPKPALPFGIGSRVTRLPQSGAVEQPMVAVQ